MVDDARRSVDGSGQQTSQHSVIEVADQGDGLAWVAKGGFVVCVCDAASDQSQTSSPCEDRAISSCSRPSSVFVCTFDLLRSSIFACGTLAGHTCQARNLL